MKYLEGSYSVEATAIFGFILGFLFVMILFGIDVYENTLCDIGEYEMSEENPVEVFRKIELGKKVIKEVLD